MNWDFDLIDGPYSGTIEGPAWDGSGLLFTHIPASKIMRFDPKLGKSTIYRSNTNNANGLIFDKTGNLFACEGGARRVVKYNQNNTTVEIAHRFTKRKLNIPNDLAIHHNGSIWFTDPYYEGAGGPWSEDRTAKELEHDSVYRLDPNDDGTWSIIRVTFDTSRPNGILFSLNYETLYVAQSGKEPSEFRQLRAYPINPDYSLGAFTVIHDFGPHRGVDGMVLDTSGNIIATAGFNQSGPGPIIYVFSPEGTILDQHKLPSDRPTNCTFGGDDLNTLYVTTGEGYLYSAKTELQGRLDYPGLI